MDDLWSDFPALDEEFLCSDEFKKSVRDEHDLLLSEEFSSIAAEYSCITDEEPRRAGPGKCMKKLLLWKEQCDAAEAKKKSTARGQERPGKSMKLLLETRDLDSEEIGESVREAKKPNTETKPIVLALPATPRPVLGPGKLLLEKREEIGESVRQAKKPKTETTVKQRIAKVFKNNKAKNTKTRRLFKLH